MKSNDDLKPSVEILMSVYKPNIEFLKEQLESINNQDYPNLRLLIHNDCPEEKLNQMLIQKTCKDIDVEILPEIGVNLGYTKAFERLVAKSKAEFIAYCDQDDVWFPNKIAKMVHTIIEDGSLLAVSEREIIDGEGRVLKEKARLGSKKSWDKWVTGDDIFIKTTVVSYAVGMAMLVNGSFARSIVPFSSNTGHDKWTIICAAAEGTVSFIDKPLVKYRRHGANVSGTLTGINSKVDYYEKRVIPFYKLIEDIETRYPFHSDIDKLKKIAEARIQHKIIDLFRNIKICPEVISFDIFVALFPKPLFQLVLKLVRHI